LAGTVKGPDGKAIEGALIVAAPVGSDERLPLTTKTDAEGRFKLALKKAGALDLRIEKQGLAIRRLEKWPSSASLDVQLAKGGVIEGTVRDGPSGATLPGVRVEARSDRAADRPLPWDPEAGSVRSKTDSKGRFRLEGLGPGTYVVEASARGYGRGRREGARPGRPLDLFVFSGGSIGGVVFGPDARPIPAAVVQARAVNRRSGAAPQLADADGRFDLLGLDPGTYTLVARVPGLAAGIAVGVVVGSEGETRADVTLRGGGRVMGRLVSGTDHPVAGRVHLQEAGGGALPDDVQELVRADAGADGRFQVEDVPSGSVVLVATARGLAPTRIDVDVRGDGAPNDLGDVSLDAGITIEGHVRDRSGGGIADVLLATYKRRGSSTTRSEARSDADGAYILPGLDTGPFRIYVAAAGFAQKTVDAEGGSANADVVLDRGGTISGLVVDDGGKPIESFHVIARAKGGSAWDANAMEVQKDVLSADGRFAVEDVGAGIQIVEVSASQNSTATLSDVKVSTGAITDVGRVRLGSGGGVRGTVVSTEGSPIPGATVSARTPSLEDYGEKQAQTDGQGAFEVRGLPAGKVDLGASHPSFADGYVAGVDVDPAKPPTETKIVLGAGGRIDGTARKRDGSPMAGVSVRVQPVLPEGRTILWGTGMTPVGADGSFVVEHVPAGHVQVGLMPGSTGRYQSVQTLEAEVREGETTSVDFVTREILVSGRVTRGSVPAPGIQIDMRGEGARMFGGGAGMREVSAAPTGPQHGTATTGEDGTYALLVDAPGHYRVSAKTPDSKAYFGARQLDVPDADSFVFDLDVGGVSVTGIVVAKADDSPVARANVSLSAKERDASRFRQAGTGADGRFQVDALPGEYTVSASAEGYAESRQDITIGEAGGDVRLTLARGLTIRGRVMDTGGQAAGGCPVSISGSSVPGYQDFVVTIADGSFEVKGLLPGAYTLFAGSTLAGFAVRSGVSPGASDVTLALQPGGQVRLRIRGPDGVPVPRAHAELRKVDGLPVNYDSIEGRAASDALGLLAVTMPAGADEIWVARDKLQGVVTVNVPSGGSASAEIVLKPSAE
jgi:uncharacterized GH25 family protein